MPINVFKRLKRIFKMNDQNKYRDRFSDLGSYRAAMSSQINDWPPYQRVEQAVERMVELMTAKELTKQKSIIEEKVNSNLIENIVKFFKLDFGTGQEIINLICTKDPANNLIAINMLLTEVKDKIKQEIISEINNK